MRILITNVWLRHFTGSEVNVLELSLFLSRAGHSVVVFAFEFGAPLSREFEANGILVRLDGEFYRDQEFDLIWGHHAAAINEVLMHGVKARHIIFSCLSPIEPLELPPPYVNSLSLVLANSDGTRDFLVAEGVRPQRVLVFPNSVDLDLWQFSEPISELKSICFVSNHLPFELLEAADVLRQRGITVDLVGHGKPTYQLITPTFLANYSVVVTIGKTVQYAMALGRPVYCYDHFGGPGYFGPTSVESLARFNFSGRGGARKSAATIASEIVDGFPVAVAGAHDLRTAVESRFSLQKNVQVLIEKLGPVSSWAPLGRFIDQRSFAGILRVLLKEREITQSGVCELFLSAGSQIDLTSVTLVTIHDGVNTVVRRVDPPMEIQAFRLDPCGFPSVVTLLDVRFLDAGRQEIPCRIRWTNAGIANGLRFEFETTDPQIEFELDGHGSLVCEAILSFEVNRIPITVLSERLTVIRSLASDYARTIVSTADTLRAAIADR